MTWIGSTCIATACAFAIRDALLGLPGNGELRLCPGQRRLALGSHAGRSPLSPSLAVGCPVDPLPTVDCRRSQPSARSSWL